MRLIDADAGSGGPDHRNAAEVSTFGTLLLVGSLAAARFGDGGRSGDYLREAECIAQLLGHDANHVWTAFGPTNVAIHRVNALAELGDMGAVLGAPPLENIESVPMERRVRYSLDIARAYGETGHSDEALHTLLSAERNAPEHVRKHHLGRKVVTALIDREGLTRGRPSTELSQIAHRMNLPRMTG